MYTLSKYSHLFISTTGKYLIYNSEINSFVELTSQQYDAILQYGGTDDVGGLSNGEIRKLKDMKIIVREDQADSYYNKIKFLTRLNCLSYDILTLNIIPTTACNFSCSYCFEENKPIRHMSDEVIDDLCTFINKNERTKKINLMWYGGEPLLALRTIEKILNRIQERTKVPVVHHSLITNGYCINDKVCTLFQKFPLNDIQITLDGTKTEHNSKRFTKTDKNTYDKIVHNIGLLLSKLPETHIHVRINIDENNKHEYHKITQELRSLYKSNKLTFYPGFIRIEDKSKKQMKAPSVLGEAKRNFYFDLDCEGESVNFYPIHRSKMCSAVKLNTYIIGPDGEFYKCWNDVGFKNKIIGYINRDKLENQDLLLRYLMDGTMFDDPKCKDCFFFPICGGGCPQYRLKNKFEGGHYNLCSTLNDETEDFEYLNRCLEEHYNIISKVSKSKLG